MTKTSTHPPTAYGAEPGENEAVALIIQLIAATDPPLTLKSREDILDESADSGFGSAVEEDNDKQRTNFSTKYAPHLYSLLRSLVAFYRQGRISPRGQPIPWTPALQSLQYAGRPVNAWTLGARLADRLASTCDARSYQPHLWILLAMTSEPSLAEHFYHRAAEMSFEDDILDSKDAILYARAQLNDIQQKARPLFPRQASFESTDAPSTPSLIPSRARTRTTSRASSCWSTASSPRVRFPSTHGRSASTVSLTTGVSASLASFIPYGKQAPDSAEAALRVFQPVANRRARPRLSSLWLGLTSPTTTATQSEPTSPLQENAPPLDPPGRPSLGGTTLPIPSISRSHYASPPTSPNPRGTVLTGTPRPSITVRIPKEPTASFGGLVDRTRQRKPGAVPSLPKLDPVLASLEKKCKLKAKIDCCVCGVQGMDFPRCGRCGDAWCSRECRLRGSGGGRHVCSSYMGSKKGKMSSTVAL